MLPGVACHITQRGVDQGETFSCDEDRQTYLRLLRQNLGDAGVSLLGWCLMTTHVHLIGLPAREESLVERNAVRAGMVRRAAAYRWSGAMSHLAGDDETGMPDIEPSRDSQRGTSASAKSPVIFECGVPLTMFTAVSHVRDCHCRGSRRP